MWGRRSHKELKECEENKEGDLRREVLEYLASEDYSIDTRRFINDINALGYKTLEEFIANVPPSKATGEIYARRIILPAPELKMRFVVKDNPSQKGVLEAPIVELRNKKIATLKMDQPNHIILRLREPPGIVFTLLYRVLFIMHFLLTLPTKMLTFGDRMIEHDFENLIPEKTYLQTHLKSLVDQAEGTTYNRITPVQTPELVAKQEVYPNDVSLSVNNADSLMDHTTTQNEPKESVRAEVFQKPDEDKSEVPFESNQHTILDGQISNINQELGPVGKRKGIEGAHNSCYMDSFLFSMFYTTHIFDFILETKQTDTKFKKKTRKILKKIVVDPLRKNHFCSWESLWDLREHLSKLNGDLLGTFMDAEQVLYILCDQALQEENFIRYGELGDDGWGDFMHLMLADTNDPLNVITVQENVTKSFAFNGDIRMATVPNPAFILGMPRSDRILIHYDAVIPNPEIDIEHLMKPEKCLFCENQAEWETQGHRDDMVPVFVCNACVSSDKPKITSESSKMVSRRRMKLNAIVCIRGVHFVAFVRASRIQNEADDQWYFFDSMAGKFPEVEIVPKMANWLSVMSNNPEKFNTETIPWLVKRSLTDGHLCFYEPVVFIRDNSHEFRKLQCSNINV